MFFLNSHLKGKGPNQKYETPRPFSVGAFPATFFVVVACLATAAGISAQSAGPRNDAAEVSAGKAAYEERCAICHFSESTAKKVGPGLKDLYPRGKFADGRKVDDASATAWIEKGGKDMPGYKNVLPSEQIRALVAYLRSL